MGGKDRENPARDRDRAKRAAPADSSDEESNETMPIPAMQQLSIHERANSGDTHAPEDHRAFESSLNFLKSKPIQKRTKRGEGESKEKLRQKMEKMAVRIQELEGELAEIKKQEDACPHCHFYLNQRYNQRESMTPEDCLFQYSKRSASRDSLEFEKIDFNTPLMYSPEMEEKSWIFLGTIMIAMGSKVMDIDGTVNVFKILKESVDRIRRQVEKSQEKLSMDFFMGKEELETDGGMNELDFDPFYHKEEHRGGLQLEGVRVESVEQYDLYFDQKLSFNVKYDSLITIMEYMKENCSISYN